MTTVAEIHKYLPHFLSASGTPELLQEIDNQFPFIHPTRMYTSVHDNEEIIFQGDGIKELLYVHFPKRKIGSWNCMVFSNSCDIDPLNKSVYSPSICYAPIIRLDKYCQALENTGKWTPEQLGSHADAIRRQKVSTAFYLPPGNKLEAESLELMDRLCHCDNNFVSRKEIPIRRLFTLSDIGAYLFMFKLSVHLLRMTDSVLR
ncbi:MAG: hypothetical protein WCG29_14240 [Desulfomonile sp.]